MAANVSRNLPQGLISFLFLYFFSLFSSPKRLPLERDASIYGWLYILYILYILSIYGWLDPDLLCCMIPLLDRESNVANAVAFVQCAADKWIILTVLTKICLFVNVCRSPYEYSTFVVSIIGRSPLHMHIQDIYSVKLNWNIVNECLKL